MTGGLSCMTAAADLPWSPRGDHLILTVRLTPKSARDEISGVVPLSDGRQVLQVRVRALPQDGAANQALVALLAKSLQLPTAAVRIQSGATGRVKCLRLRGEPSTIVAAIEKVAKVDRACTGARARQRAQEHSPAKRIPVRVEKKCDNTRT
jgi:uncharacterized protein (TIGR00251 family)